MKFGGNQSLTEKLVCLFSSRVLHMTLHCQNFIQLGKAKIWLCFVHRKLLFAFWDAVIIYHFMCFKRAFHAVTSYEIL